MSAAPPSGETPLATPSTAAGATQATGGGTAPAAADLLTLFAQLLQATAGSSASPAPGLPAPNFPALREGIDGRGDAEAARPESQSEALAAALAWLGAAPARPAPVEQTSGAEPHDSRISSAPLADRLASLESDIVSAVAERTREAAAPAALLRGAIEHDIATQGAGEREPVQLELAAASPAPAQPPHLGPTARSTAPPVLHAQVGTPAWQEELGARLTWMAERGEHSASLRLSPEQLGPLEIRIAMKEGEASVWFGAASAETRSALEQSLPRLRELFAAQGLALADAGVSRDAPREPPRPTVVPAQGGGVEPDAAPGSTDAPLARVGLVDLFA